jgi:hypothetical protein
MRYTIIHSMNGSGLKNNRTQLFTLAIDLIERSYRSAISSSGEINLRDGMTYASTCLQYIKGSR